MGINTKLIHPQKGADYENGQTLPPVSQVNAFTYESSAKLEKVFENKAFGYAYTRIGNPTVNSFEERINELEGGKGATACSSGMAAVSLALLNVLSSGDEIIAGAGLFGGTLDLFRDIEAFGIKVVYAPRITKEFIKPLITEKTRAVFAEVIENPGLYIMDIKETADFLHERGIPLFADSTTATAVLVKPIEFGADIVIESSSKYINGSSNSIGGVIIDAGTFKWDVQRYPVFKEWKKYGPYAYTAKLRNTLWRNMGACMAPMNAYLNIVGLETMGLRVKQSCSNARILAQELSKEEGITVNYPSLCDDEKQLSLIKNQMNNMAGAILTLRTASKESAFKLIDSLRYAGIASNLGDVRTLVIHPASTIYLHSSEKAREAAGVYEGTIRVSVGIEDVEDLVSDFSAAIHNLRRQ